MICSVHHKPSVYREGGISKKTGKKYNAFWGCDVITNGQYCKAEQIDDGNQTTLNEVREPVREKVNDWIPVKEKENSSMLRMSALKAASEVVSAYIGRPDVTFKDNFNITDLLLKVSERNLLWLKGLASSVGQPEEG